MAIFAGQKEVLGAVGLTVKNCRFENVGFGVWTEYAGSSDFYIADNLFLGRDDRFRLIGWTGPMWASAGALRLAPAHELLRDQGLRAGACDRPQCDRLFPRRDRHLDVRDAAAGSRTGGPRRSTSTTTICTCSNDDFVETDGGVHNVRVMNNRGVNAAQGGYSSQPVFGGPVYFYRQHPVSRAHRRGVQVLGQAGRACSSTTTRSSASRSCATHRPTCTSGTTCSWAATPRTAAS